MNSKQTNIDRWVFKKNYVSLSRYFVCEPHFVNHISLATKISKNIHAPVAFLLYINDSLN